MLYGIPKSSFDMYMLNSKIVFIDIASLQTACRSIIRAYGRAHS